MAPLAARPSSWLQAAWQNGWDGRPTQHVCLTLPKGSKTKILSPGKIFPRKTDSEPMHSDSDPASFQSENWHTEEVLLSSDRRRVTESKCGKLVTAHSGYIFEITLSFMTSAWIRNPEDGNIATQTKNESTGKQRDKCHISYLHLCVKQEDSVSLVFSLVPTLSIMTNVKAAHLQYTRKTPTTNTGLTSPNREYGGERWGGKPPYKNV